MNISVKGRGLEVTAALREYVEKRLSKFDKLLDAEEAVAVLQAIKDMHRAEITIYVSGMVLRGEDEGYNMYACIDDVSEKLERQIERYRGRFSKKGRPGVASEFIAPLTMPVEESVVRTKSFSPKPMSVDEAIVQMNLLQHSFFAFANEASGEINVIYCRKGGGYGLLEPDR